MQLAALHNSLIEMAALIESAISRATKALVEQDAEAAREIMSQDDEIDSKERDIESLCLKLLLSQHPVARDLRQISTTLKMITDLERIGDHASDISELCVYLTGTEYADKLDHISDMAAATIKMVGESIDAFVKEDIALAQSVIEYDNVVDEIFMSSRRELIESVRANADSGEQAFDLLQIAKYYERIGDHAVNIAEWVIFSITGVHKDKQVL
jgi:phosphate transport system protein